MIVANRRMQRRGRLAYLFLTPWRSVIAANRGATRPTMQPAYYDVLVIGGGHAGAEAAWAAAGLGARTALLTFRRDAIGRMSCNPAIGGIGKGQMVREIDALGGLMGLVADETGIQFRMLNRRKGPAVWSPRCQSDSAAYAAAVQRRLAERENLTILEAAVESIEAAPIHPKDRTTTESLLRVTGVRLGDGSVIRCDAVVVTSGTFLAALMHCGERKTPGGRIGEAAATGLSASLAGLGLQLGRLKTGTPPRLRRESIDFAALDPQPGDDPPTPFSFLNDRIPQTQVHCWSTFTNAAIHDLIRANLHRAPMYCGQIQSRGPRYCPSIEDKVVRFADKDRHQVFLEPEGRDSERIYANGISTSLPQDVQHEIVRRIPGLECAEIVQYGYAVEYDYVPPHQTLPTLMTRRVAGLFLAGQINGTSGYEEAAGQGLMAGLNAARWAAGRPMVTLGRDQAYVGVMIDDLVTTELLEPYRMFTSRAEHRLHLRYDNADERLTPLGRELGLVDDCRWERFQAKRRRAQDLHDQLSRRTFEGAAALRYLKRPDASWTRLEQAFPDLALDKVPVEIVASLLVSVQYAGYIERQVRLIDQQRALEQTRLPSDLNYFAINHLRREAAERLSAIRPLTLGQAARVSGVRPTDVTVLMVAAAGARSEAQR